MNVSRTVARSGRSGQSSTPARGGSCATSTWRDDSPSAALPVLFGEPPALGELTTAGVRQPVLGGPGDLPPEQWLYLAYGGPVTLSQRRTAEQVMELAYGQAASRCSVSVFRPYLAVRTPIGAFLLARDDRGWYVAAIARGMAGPPVRTFGELRRAASWWRMPESAAA